MTFKIPPMTEQNTEQDPVPEYILERSGWISVIAFPWFTGILCLIAAITGLIHYPQTTNAKVQFIAINRIQNTITAEIDLPENFLFRIDTGQRIQLRLPDYPFDRFGTLAGRVNYIYGLTPNNSLKARIFLPMGLKTSRQFEIEFRHGQKADALVIIKDMNLIQRIFNGPARTIR